MTTLTAQKKYTCLACGYTSRRRWRFILLGTRLVCRDITKCKGQNSDSPPEGTRRLSG